MSDLTSDAMFARRHALAMAGDWSCSRHVVIADADHYMENRQKELVAAIVPFLDRAFARLC